jgi:hypothetical protein
VYYVLDLIHIQLDSVCLFAWQSRIGLLEPLRGWCLFRKECLWKSGFSKNSFPELAKVWSITAEPKVLLFLWLFCLNHLMDFWQVPCKKTASQCPSLLLWSGVRIGCAPVLWVPLYKVDLAVVCGLPSSHCSHCTQLKFYCQLVAAMSKKAQEAS